MSTERARLIELTPDECWSALALEPVGRLAWHADQRTHILPVNFTVHDGSIWLRTTPYGEVARSCLRRPVAFEVDDLHTDTRSGTSVVVSGTAEPERRLPDELGELHTWAGGVRSLLVRIEVSEISGRRLVPASSRDVATKGPQ